MRGRRRKLRIAEAQFAGFVPLGSRLHGNFRAGGGAADVAQLVKHGSLLPDEEQQP